MVVKNTGWLNPTSATVSSGSVANINNITNSDETYCQFTGSGLIMLSYSLPRLNRYSKYRDYQNVRHAQRISPGTAYLIKIVTNNAVTYTKTTLVSSASPVTEWNSSYLTCSPIGGGMYTLVPLDGYDVRYYFAQRYISYVEGTIGEFSLKSQNINTIGLFTNFTIEISCNYSIYANEEVVFKYTLPAEFEIINMEFLQNSSSYADSELFEYRTHDPVNKQIKFKLKSSFLNQFYTNINNEYTNQFKIKLTLKGTDTTLGTNNLVMKHEELSVNSNIPLPQVVIYDELLYSGTKTKMNSISNYLLFEDTDIMPQNEGDIYLDNLNLIDFTKSELYDITADYSNDLNSNYAENKGNIQSLLLDSNSISIKLLSKINDFNTLTDVVSEIFANYKTNLRLKLGVLPNKIISCSLKNIEPELHRTYSWLNFEFEKTQRTPYNHYSLTNIINNQFVVNNYQRESAVITIKGSGNSCNLSITDQDGIQTMTINHAFNNEILIDSKANKVYIDKFEMDLQHLTYDSEFFELKGKCTATIDNGDIFKVVI